MGIIRKGVLSYGVAHFFRSGAVGVPRTRKPRARARAAKQQELGPQEPSEQENSAHIISVKEETHPDGTVPVSAADGRENTTPSPYRDANTRASGTEQPMTTYRKGLPVATNQPKNRPTRKRRRSDADTGSDSASMTETSDTEVSLVAPNFDMKLRPENRHVNTYGSDGESRQPDSDDSDGAWVPHAEEVGRRIKRVRRG
jgi:hypothetical protein